MPPSFPHERERWSRRRRPALVSALILISLALPAARALAQAAAPFPVVEVRQPPPARHGWAYVALGSGVVLVGGSFLLSGSADRAYDAYLEETDPARIETLYDRAVLHDRLATATLLTGEALIVTGVYLRFVRTPRPSRVGFAVAPTRCALSLRF